MAGLTYIPPAPPARPFKVGDVVEIIDREHKVLSLQTIRKANKSSVVTACGRRWRRDGWRMDGERLVWPFPSIRLPQRPPQ